MSEEPFEPTDENARYFADLCTVIGFVVIHWSLTEQQLDTWVNLCVNNAGGAALLRGHGVPKQLGRKIEFIKRCLAQLPALASFRAECAALLARVKSASGTRHDLIHGALTELRPDPTTGAFKFRIVGYAGDLHTFREFNLTPNDFREFAPILTDLVTDAIAFSQKLGDSFLGP